MLLLAEATTSSILQSNLAQHTRYCSIPDSEHRPPEYMSISPAMVDALDVERCRFDKAAGRKKVLIIPDFVMAAGGNPLPRKVHMTCLEDLSCWSVWRRTMVCPLHTFFSEEEIFIFSAIQNEGYRYQGSRSSHMTPIQLWTLQLSIRPDHSGRHVAGPFFQAASATSKVSASSLPRDVSSCDTGLRIAQRLVAVTCELANRTLSAQLVATNTGACIRNGVSVPRRGI
ncbi:hypothetical protein CC78DRAFT_619882 [Lojkania enalia]|uniref:Uncharacterized protein n=1 Tax=Lojkania enalia TaxID=147567 RepID=A0A9P4K7J0_9PLEO|nr:hypothetical protein CC78DRAFT_619882 [Didymosphaeria enalia]